MQSRSRRPKHKSLFGMDYRERGPHARGVYPTQDTSRMETARLKQEEEEDTRIIVEYMKYGRYEEHYKRKSAKQGLICAKDLTIELSEMY